MKNTFVKVLSFLMALTMIVGMFGAMTISAAAHTHTKGEQVGEPVPATCASIGYTLYVCAECGETYPDDVVPMASEHTGIVDVPASEATCTYPAMTAGQFCEDCGKWIDDKAAQPVEDSKPLGHTFVGAHEGTICERINYYVCATCDLTYEEAKKADANDKTLAALKAAYPEIKWTTYDDKYAKDIVAVGHKYVYEVKTASTVCENGVVVATCETCEKTYEIVLEAPHKFDATYKACEEYVGNKCSLCGTPAPNVVVNYYTDNHNWELDGTAPKVYKALNAALQALGYTSDTVYVAATCTEAGYKIQYCKDCKQYIKIDVKAAGHDWKDDVKKDVNKTTACFAGYTVYRECNECDAVDVLNTVSDRGHVLHSTVIPSTCTSEGYTYDVCLNPACDYEKKYDYKEALGHTWGEYQDKQGGYGNHSVDYVKTRFCVVCGAEDPNPVVVVEATGTHVFDTAITLSKATCLEKSYYIKACTVEGCTEVKIVDANGNDSVTKTYVGDYDKTNHDSNPDNLVAKQAAVASTCTKEGSQAMFCKNCQVDVTVKFPKLAHDWGTVYDDGKDGKLNTAADKNLTEVLATCTKTGKTAGVVCTLCGTTKVAQQTTPVNKENHVDSKGNKVTGLELDKAGANCQNAGWVKTYYSCCDTTVTSYNAGAIDADKHVNVTVYEAKEATCEEDGNHLYIICNDCGALEIKESYTQGTKTYTCKCGAAHAADLASYVIRAEGHKGAVSYVPAKAETCSANGYTAHYVYSVCGCKIGYKDVLAHGDAYKAKVYEKAPTCTEDGINIFANDTTVAVYDKTFYVVDCTKCQTLYDEVDANGHYYTTTNMNKNSGDCTLPTYDLNVCAVCGDIYADNYAAPKYTAHRYDIIKHTYSVKDGYIQFDGKDYIVDGAKVPACAMPTFTYQECVNTGCAHYEIDYSTYKAPVAHYSTELNNEKVEITWSCTGIEASLNMTCDLCNKKVLAADVEHNAQVAQKTATCTEDGYYLYVCVDCGAYLDVDGNKADDTDDDTTNDSVSVVYPALGHNPYDVNGDGKADYATTGRIIANSIYAVNNTVDYVVKAQKATAYADGFIEYMCRNCDTIVTVVIPALTGIELDITTDDVIVNNGTFTVDVAVTAKDFAFNSMTFAVEFDTTAVKFESAALAYGFEAADGVTVVAKNNAFYGAGYALVNVYVPNGVDGLAKNVTVTGEEVAFVTLTFSVLPTATLYTYIDSTTGEIMYSSVIDDVDFTEIKVVDEKGKLVDKNTTATCDVDYDALVLNYLGDVNGDTKIDAGDSVAIMTLMYNKEYSVAADVNADGVVDLADHVAVLEFTVSIQTMVNYLEMMGITVEGLVADYNLKYDLDNDKDIDSTDKALLAAALEAELAEYGVWYNEMARFLSYCGVNSIEELVDEAAYDLATTGVIELIDGIIA